MEEEKLKLSNNLERTSVDGFRCNYIYKFTTNQWLEEIDNPEYFGIGQFKETVIDVLVDEFRRELEKSINSKQNNISYN